MTPGHVLEILALAHLAAAVSPGPNTVLVVQNAIRSRSLGLLTALGFWPARAFWSAAGLAGVGGILSAAPGLAVALRLVCGGYLLWLGIKAILRSMRPGMAADVSTGAALPWRRAMLAGFLTNLGNPKSIAYYMSVFAAAGAFTLPLLHQVAAVLMMPSIGFLWYGGLVVLMSGGPARRGLATFSRWLDRIAGAAMIFFGFRLVSAP